MNPFTAERMKTIWFMRHGQTDWNIQRRLQGTRDIPLNETGICQAREAGERIARAGLSFDTVIASPLCRSVDTAALVTGWDRDRIRLDPRLTEIGYGEYEGELFSQLDGEMLAFIRDPDHCPPPESVETIDALLERAAAFLEDLKTADGESILAVTHGVAIRALIGCLNEENRAMVWGMPVHNCQLVKTTLENGRYSPAEMPEI